MYGCELLFLFILSFVLFVFYSLSRAAYHIHQGNIIYSAHSHQNVVFSRCHQHRLCRVLGFDDSDITIVDIILNDMCTAYAKQHTRIYSYVFRCLFIFFLSSLLLLLVSYHHFICILFTEFL